MATTSRMSRARVLATVAAFLAVPRAGSTQTLEKIRFVGVFTDDLTPVFYAIHNGAFQKAGIDLEIVSDQRARDSGGRLRFAYEMGEGALASLIAPA